MPQPANSSHQRSTSRPTRRWPAMLVLCLLIILLVVGVAQRQAIGDWLTLYGYQPPATISQLADETTMTPAARHLFYLNKPLIADKNAFTNYCKQQERSIVLGCYHGGESGIYLLKIDPHSTLHGVMQVTAAHEMLHAAYDRLPASQKASIDRQLEDFYQHGLTDKAIKAEVDAYRQSEPGQLDNEMHSIFATEVPTLPSGLSHYYQRYFYHRQAIVEQAEQYQDTFRSRQAAIKRYDAELAQLKATISNEQVNVSGQSLSLDRQRAQLEQERAAGNTEAYNSGVTAYNQRATAYNDLLAALKADIKRYNQIVTRRNKLVLEEQQLVKQLNGATVPAAQP